MNPPQATTRPSTLDALYADLCARLPVTDEESAGILFITDEMVLQLITFHAGLLNHTTPPEGMNTAVVAFKWRGLAAYVGHYTEPSSFWVGFLGRIEDLPALIACVLDSPMGASIDPAAMQIVDFPHNN
jgi:hypothetical protein